MADSTIVGHQLGEPKIRVYIGEPPIPNTASRRWWTHSFADRGGTFTDCMGIVPGKPDIVIKLLSVDPTNYSEYVMRLCPRVH